MSGETLFPIALSLKVGIISLIFVTPPGILLAWFQARKRYSLRGVVEALILLPLVLPPSVVGYLLVVVLGRSGFIGRTLESLFDLHLVFSPAAAIIASSIVALPLLVKTAEPAIEAVPVELEDVGRSLGLAPLSLFFRITLPSAWRGVIAGMVLAFARAIGEFGATLMFAGNIPLRTNTMPLEIFAAYQIGDDARAVLYVAVLIALSLLVVMAASRLAPRITQ